jgi:hypothetical protein
MVGFEEDSVYVPPTAPRTIGGVLDDGIRLYRESWSTSWKIALALELVIAIPSYAWQSQISVIGAPSNPLAAAALLRSPTLWLLWLIALPIYLVFYNAIIANINGVATAQPAAIGRAIGIGARVLPRAVLLGILIALIVIVGLILLLVPGIYWAGTLQLAFIALVVEDTGVTDSMSVSRRLIKGHWWRTATLYSLCIVIVLVFSLAIGFLSGLIAAFAGPRGSVTLALTQLIAIVQGTLIAPLFPAVLIAMYYDLKLRTQGADLADRVNALAPK